MIRRIRDAEPYERGLFKLGAVCSALILLLATLALAYGALSNASRAQVQSLQAQTQALQAQVQAAKAQAVVLGSCQFSHDIATAKIPANTNSLGLTILADSRIWYITSGCVPKYGSLPKPDPRLVPYLPPGMR